MKGSKGAVTLGTVLAGTITALAAATARYGTEAGLVGLVFAIAAVAVGALTCLTAQLLIQRRVTDSPPDRRRDGRGHRIGSTDRSGR